MAKLGSPEIVRDPPNSGLEIFASKRALVFSRAPPSRWPSAHPSCSCSPAPARSSSEGAPKICVVAAPPAASSFCLKMNSVCESDQRDEGAVSLITTR